MNVQIVFVSRYSFTDEELQQIIDKAESLKSVKKKSTVESHAHRSVSDIDAVKSNNDNDVLKSYVETNVFKSNGETDDVTSTDDGEEDPTETTEKLASYLEIQLLQNELEQVNINFNIISRLEIKIDT